MPTDDLQQPDHAVLNVQGVGVLDVRVQTLSLSVADLELFPPTTVVAGLDGRTAELVMWGGMRFVGRVESDGSGGRVRFVRQTPGRREWTRADADLPALVVPDRLDRLWRARVRDISAGGALIADAEDLPLGARFHLELELDTHEDQRPLSTRARAIRATAHGERAVTFDELDAAERIRIQRFVLLRHVRRLQKP